MKLKYYCNKIGISYSTGIRWFHAGKIPGARQISGTGTIIVDDPVEESKKKEFHHSLENDVRYFLEILGLKKDVVDKIVEIVRKEKPE